MRFPWVTLAPVPIDKRQTLFRIFLSTIIYFDAGGSDWLIKFGALVTFCFLIDSLHNTIFMVTGDKNFFFDFYSLSLDDYESLGAFSSSLAIFFFI